MWRFSCVVQHSGFWYLREGGKWGENYNFSQLTSPRGFPGIRAAIGNPDRGQHSPRSEETEYSIQGGQSSQNSWNTGPEKGELHGEGRTAERERALWRFAESSVWSLLLYSGWKNKHQKAVGRELQSSQRDGNSLSSHLPEVTKPRLFRVSGRFLS